MKLQMKSFTAMETHIREGIERADECSRADARMMRGQGRGSSVEGAGSTRVYAKNERCVVGRVMFACSLPGM